MAQWWTLMVFFKLENLIFLHNQFLKPNLAHPFLRETIYEEFGFFSTHCDSERNSYCLSSLLLPVLGSRDVSSDIESLFAFMPDRV